MEIVAQIIGFIALAFTVIGFQVNHRKKLLRIFTVSASLYTLHFILLGAFTGAAMNGLNIPKNYIFSKKYDYEWTQSRWVLFSFLVIFIIAGALTWDGWYSILPVTSMTVGVIAAWQKSTKVIRFMALISPPLWFVYNFIVGSYAGMVVEVMTVTSLLIAIWRYDRPGKSKKIAKRYKK